MDTKTAIEMVGRMAVLPGWKLEAKETPTANEILLWVTNPNPYTDQDSLGEDGTYHIYPKDEGRPPIRNPFYFMVNPETTTAHLYGEVLKCINAVNEHEWREALRDRDTEVSYLHPHREDSVRAFSDVSGRGWNSIMDDVEYNTLKYPADYM